MAKLKKKSKPKTRPTGYSIERGFISKLLETKDIKYIKDIGINSSFFTGEHKQVFIFIQNSFKENGAIPTVRMLEQKYPSYEVEYYNDEVGTEETLSYWCQELRNKAKHNKMADIVEEVADTLNKEGETEEAYSINGYLEVIKSKIINLEIQYSLRNEVLTIEEIKVYELKKEGRSNSDISEILDKPYKNITNTISRIKCKLISLD